jgi:hypothetical protein
MRTLQNTAILAAGLFSLLTASHALADAPLFCPSPAQLASSPVTFSGSGQDTECDITVNNIKFEMEVGMQGFDSEADCKKALTDYAAKGFTYAYGNMGNSVSCDYGELGGGLATSYPFNQHYQAGTGGAWGKDGNPKDCTSNNVQDCPIIHTS